MKTRTPKKTARPTLAPKDRAAAVETAHDAARVLMAAYTQRRARLGYTAADDRLSGAEAYAAALTAMARAKAPAALLTALDNAHGAALAATEDRAFAAGLQVGLGLIGGAR